MKDYDEWKKDYLAGSDTRKYLVEKQLREEFEKQFGALASLGKEPNVSHSASKSSLDEHKHSLRQNTAYSGLRNYLSITAWLTAIGCVILGFVLIDENIDVAGVTLLIAGPLLAALQYFIASVYFDIADAGLNTSMRIQDLHRMERSKETDPKIERS